MWAFKFIFAVMVLTKVDCNQDGKKEKNGDKIAELFSQLDNGTYKVRSEIANHDYNSVLCWLETVNIVEYKNGSRSIDRQFSMILETPADLSNSSLDLHGSSLYEGTKKSKHLNFTTLYKTKSLTVKVNRTLICGAGPVITKEYIQWDSGKKRVQINLGTKKMLENYAMETLMRRKYITPEKLRLYLKKDDDEDKVIVKKQFKRSDDCHCELALPNCGNATHKMAINIGLIAEYQAIDRGVVISRIPLANVERTRDFNIRLNRDAVGEEVEGGDVNKSWDRFVKLLAREYCLEYLHRIVPFYEMTVNRINGTVDEGGEELPPPINDDTAMKICCIRKHFQFCENNSV